MSRTVKRPKERKKEIVDTAEKLFMEKGYENTSVMDIVENIGVAKGLFYYYFESKKDIIEEIVNRMLVTYEKEAKKFVEDSHLTAREKFARLIRLSNHIEGGREYMIWVFRGEKNILLYHKLRKKTQEKILPLFTKIIKQGVEEGVFDTEYPEMAAKFIFSSNTTIEIPKNPLRDIEKLKKQYVAAIDLMERVLGAEKGSIKSLYAEGIENFEETLSKYQEKTGEISWKENE